ncbi:STAS/SEC14 domain-containing protein, partial [Mesorhizobium sp. M7A.F.Ca.CA.002.15.2.1]
DAQRFLPSSPPIEIRHFRTEDEAAAWQWLAAQPIGATASGAPT